jgi:hypothetical protein
MRSTVEMVLNDIIFIPRLMKIGSGIQVSLKLLPR